MVLQYDIFRTTFVQIENDDSQSFLQVVLKYQPIEWTEYEVIAGDVDEFIEKLLSDDLQNPLQLGISFNNFILIKISDDNFKFIWISHHALTDAWYMDSFEDDLLKAFENQSLPYRKPYKYYIDYILRTNEQKSTQFWSEYLKNAYPTPFPDENPKLELKVYFHKIFLHHFLIFY
jgi:hypothetical protein